MSKHFFKLLFGALFLVSATAFTGCNDDDKEPTPVLTASPEVLNFTDETPTTQTIEIKANCHWEVSASALQGWATITPMEGNGNATLTVAVEELPAGTNSREGVISFNLTHSTYGKWGLAESKVTVKQFAEGVTPPPAGDPIYTDNFGVDGPTASPWTAGYVGTYQNWEMTGTGSSTVTYDASGSVGVRCNSFSNNKYSTSEYSKTASGKNNIYLNAAGAYLTVKDITLPAGKTNFKFTFGICRSEYGNYDAPFVASEFSVALSPDGAAWTDITYERSDYSSWDLATANFTLKEATDKLFIRVKANAVSGRLDDFTFAEGTGGQIVEFGEAPDPTKKSIGDIKTAGTYETEGTIVARGKMAYIIADNTGAMMVYHKDNERTVGEKITISGDVTIFNASSTPQFDDKATVNVVSTGNNWTYNPAVLDAAAMDALVTAAPVCKEVQFEGTMEVSGNNINVNIDGASTAIGSIKYIDNATVSQFDGQKIVVKGYFVGVSASKYVNVLPYSVEESGAPADPKISSVSPASLSFAAAGEAKEVNVTLNSAAQGLAIEASSDDSQFTAAVNGTKVTVTAAENATAAAITGTLTISLMQNGSAIDTKTVNLTQAAKSSGGGDETTVTMSFEEIKAGNTTGADMPVNSYGSQAVADLSTWYTWSHGGLDFSGARICEASNTDYLGTLQMQGNASDAAKQGFFGNVTDLGKITKIVVVSKNTKYSPTEHLYMGTEANPSGNAQESTIVQDGEIYTETFDIVGDYGFFKLHNDKQGAFYVQSISITYTK